MVPAFLLSDAAPSFDANLLSYFEPDIRERAMKSISKILQESKTIAVVGLSSKPDRALWMQLGIEHQAAADLARAAGLDVVRDQCIKVDHRIMSA